MLTLFIVMCFIILPNFGEPKLQFTQVFMHHGKKIVKELASFPGDPPGFQHTLKTPFENGELSNEGTWGAYTLGINLRTAYGKLLDFKYAPSKLRVLSRTVHRSITSVELALAAFLPPVAEQIWNTQLLWQPIPVFSEKILDHASTTVLLECPTLAKQLLESGVYETIFSTFSNTTNYLSELTGVKIPNIIVLQELMGSILGRLNARRTVPLPDWMLDPNFEINLQKKYSLINMEIYNPFLDSIGGWHFDKLVSGMNDFLNKRSSYKMILYSAHEANTIIMTKFFNINKTWKTLPRISSYFAFELHHEGDDYIVKNTIFLWVFNHEKLNGTREELFFNDCPSPCTFTQFANFNYTRTTSDKWWQICKGSNQPDCLLYESLSGVLMLFAIILIACLVSVFCSRSSLKKNYSELNNGETKSLL